MHNRRKSINRLAALWPLLAVGLSAPSQALQIDALVADNGGSFHYDISVLNDDPIVGLVDVFISDVPLGDALITASLTGPTGFATSHDTGLGLIDFLADGAGLFPVGLTESFGFDSLSGPAGAFMSFGALNLDGDLFSGTINTRLVRAVPAPGVLTLFALGLGILWQRRAKRQPKAFTHFA